MMTDQAILADGFDPALLRAVDQALASADPAAARTLVAGLHPADTAALFQQLPAYRRGTLALALGPDLGADIISELNDWVRDEVLHALGTAQVAEAVGDMETDDAVALIEELAPAEQAAVLDALDADDRVAIESALAWPEESAGRLMQRELVAVPPHWTVGHVIDFLRREAAAASDFLEIFVVDEGYRPVGTMKLSRLLTAPRVRPVADLMQREQTLIPAGMDQEEVARRFQKYALISAAVVDDSGRLAGVITADDILHIVSEEAGEDILKLSGAGEGDINEPILDSYRARVKWLVANLGTALVSASVIAAFGGTIEEMVILAALTPIVASIGGNTGNQTMAVVVRALATGQLTRANSARTVRRELVVALMNGLTIAIILGIGVGFFLANIQLGAVIAAATLFNLLFAGLAGVLVPLGLQRLGTDPAVASSVFVTMITDSMGFLLFLGLATATGLTSA